MILPTTLEVVTEWHRLLRADHTNDHHPINDGTLHDGEGGYDPFGLLVVACLNTGVPIMMPPADLRRGLPHPLAAACACLGYDQVHGHPSDMSAWCSGGDVFRVAQIIEDAPNPAMAWKQVAVWVHRYVQPRAGETPCNPGVLMEGAGT